MRRILLFIFALPSLGYGQVEKDSLPSSILEPISIRATQVDSVWGSEVLNVADFVFYQRQLFLLTYKQEKRLKRVEHAKRTLLEGGKLIRVDEKGAEEIWIDFGDLIVERIVKIHDGVLLVACENRIAMVSLDCHGEPIGFLNENVFLSEIAPIVGESEVFSYLTSFQKERPFCEYFAYNHLSGHNQLIASVEDAYLKDLFKSQYKYLPPQYKREAAQYEADYGVDKLTVAAYMTSFHTSIYYRPLHVPTFVYDHQFMVFDHYANQLIVWDEQTAMMNSFPLIYPMNISHFSGKVWLDQSSGISYTSGERLGKIEIYAIDIPSGSATKTTTLEHRYVDKIAVHDGSVYFIYRPFESSQNRYLYKQRIFGQAN